MVLKNVGTLPHHYTLSHPRRTWIESLQPWRYQVLQLTTFTWLFLKN